MPTIVAPLLARCPTCRRNVRECGCLFDIRDPSAFVHATINQKRLILSVDEREELHAEGMAILHKLAADYKPHIQGHEHEGRFSGYAAWALPKKLGDAWHRLNPNHVLVTQRDENGKPTGKRSWVYGERTLSLEAVVADDPERSSLLSDDRTRRADWGTRAHRALFDRWTRRIEIIVRVGELLREGATPADVAHTLGLDGEQVREAIEEIRMVYDRIEGEDSE